MPDGEIFGRTGDGQAVQRFSISGGGLTASIMTFGAAVQDLRLAGHEPPLVLGFDKFDPYPQHSPYFGAIAGRYANRIRDGRFALAGKRHQTDRNFMGKHTLHGGKDSFAFRNWDVLLHAEDFVTLSLHDPDGSMGFPGALDATCTYRMKIPGTLTVELSAVCSEPTLCNLAHHSYFNLDDGGSGTVLDHRMTINAGAYLPVDPELIPTGVVQPVDGTDFDFRAARPIRTGASGPQLGYDHNFCLSSARGPMRQAAWVQGAASGVEMEVWTTEPGVQFYAGEHVARTVPGLGRRMYAAYSGLCFEPQIWPDSPNRAYFPQAVLWPGEIYRQVTEYRFRGASA